MSTVSPRRVPSRSRGAAEARSGAAGVDGGYTLLEILVAMSLLVLVGGGLITLLNQGVRIWRTSESRGLVYERARALLDQISEDLRSMVVLAPAPTDAGWVRCLCDEDPSGRQRLRFLRTTSAESSDALLREGGRFPVDRTPAHVDGTADLAEAAAGVLAAPSGSMEILYLLDPRAGERVLWRGFRSPAGGPGSLMIDRNVEEAPEGRERAGRRRPERPPEPRGGKAPAGEAGFGGTPPPDEPGAAPFYLSRVAAPIARDVLHVGFRFWTPGTNTWKPLPPLVSPRPGQESGPTSWWDSSRAILDLPCEAGIHCWRRIPGSLDDPSDDVFPERVEVTVVVRAEYSEANIRLAEPVSERDELLRLVGSIELPAEPADRFVMVDDEWIEIEETVGQDLRVARDGRGRRWTRPAKHEIGAAVEAGVTFRRVVEVPARRAQYAETSSSSRGGTVPTRGGR